MHTQNDNTTIDKTLVIERRLNLPLSTVWKAWSEADNFKKWWGPQEFSCPSCTIDFTVGGKYLACMKAKKDGKEIWSTGFYQEIIPGKKIVYTDSFSDSEGKVVDSGYYDMPPMPAELLVTVTLEEIDGQTNMVMQHGGIPEDMQDDCMKGWQSSFGKMETAFTKMAFHNAKS
jgi:uncharacterized protein YndB with AHSA1/START domain